MGGGGSGVANVSDLSVLSSLVVLPFFSYFEDIWTQKGLTLGGLFFSIVVLAVHHSMWCVLINYVFANMKELLARSVKAYKKTSAIKSLSSVCVNMSWPDDFISRYLFVSWSTPPIINGPPCILKHAECMCMSERVRDRDRRQGRACL